MVLSSCNDGYRVEGNKVVYEGPWNAGNSTKVIELNADPKTFEVLGSDNKNWAKDSSTVFWGYIPLSFMDTNTFEVLSINFGKDKDKVICGKDVIIETKPNDFKTRRFTDSAGYTYIYGVDSKAAYLCSTEPNGYTRIATQSVEAFEQLEDGFYKDNEKVYWRSSELIDVVPDDFFVLGGGYGSDNINVYYHSRIVNGADIETFEVIGNFTAKDKNQNYFMDERSL